MSRTAESFYLDDEQMTEDFGAKLAKRLSPGSLLSLEGDLGMGKTVLVRGLARGLGHDASGVSSPSFVLAIEHCLAEPPLLHVDLYRLADGAGIDDLGIEESLDAGFVVAVEWGQRLPSFLRRQAWQVLLGPVRDDPRETRRLATLLPP